MKKLFLDMHHHKGILLSLCLISEDGEKSFYGESKEFEHQVKQTFSEEFFKDLKKKRDLVHAINESKHNVFHVDKENYYNSDVKYDKVEMKGSINDISLKLFEWFSYLPKNEEKYKIVVRCDLKFKLFCELFGNDLFKYIHEYPIDIRDIFNSINKLNNMSVNNFLYLDKKIKDKIDEYFDIYCSREDRVKIRTFLNSVYARLKNCYSGLSIKSTSFWNTKELKECYCKIKSIDDFDKHFSNINDLEEKIEEILFKNPNIDNNKDKLNKIQQSIKKQIVNMDLLIQQID